MISTLKNNEIAIEVNSQGAELWSLKKANDTFEYLWQGDATYWTGRSPVLFPNVGAVKDNKMTVDGKVYPLGNHGFPRKMAFELIEKNDSSLTYSFTANDETKAMYPFNFELLLTYSLEASCVTIDYKVKNLDTKEMYFQLGTHPGFNCPMQEGLEFDDYYLAFNKEETANRLFFDDANLLITNKEEAGLSGNTMALKHDLFYEGAAIFRNLNSNEVTLKSDKNDRFVKLSYNKFPYLGVWQKPDAPYICIEPWHGISDEDTYVGEFKNKEMMLNLEADKEYDCFMKIEI